MDITTLITHPLFSNNLIIADFSSIPNSGEYELVTKYDSTTNNWTWLNFTNGFTVLPDPQLNSITPNIGLRVNNFLYQLVGQELNLQ